MPVKIEAFQRSIELFATKVLSPEAAKRHHIFVARKVLAGIVAHDPAGNANYQIFTDGSPTNSEDAVHPYGVIQYVFLRMPAAGRLAISTARDLSPIRSGRYKSSWFLIANGKEVSEHDIPADTSELILTNDVPYARKIQVRGARLRDVPPGIVERIRQIVLRRFKATLSANIQYITLQRGYVLQRDYVQRRKSGRQRLHTKAGTDLRYPALILRREF